MTTQAKPAQKRTRRKSPRKTARAAAPTPAHKPAPVPSPALAAAAGLDRFMRLPEVLAITGLARSTVYALAQRGEFPRSYRTGARASGWRESEIKAWIESRPVS